MKRRYLLDTNHASYLIDNLSAAVRLRMTEVVIAARPCISVVTEAELRYGAAKKPSLARLPFLIDILTKQVDVLVWGREEAAAYAVLRAQQQAIGRPLAALDTMIAAQAIAGDLILVTHDKALQSVDSLDTEDWATDIP